LLDFFLFFYYFIKGYYYIVDLNCFFRIHCFFERLLFITLSNLQNQLFFLLNEEKLFFFENKEEFVTIVFIVNFINGKHPLVLKFIKINFFINIIIIKNIPIIILFTTLIIILLKIAFLFLGKFDTKISEFLEFISVIKFPLKFLDLF
jgi:hypothetical protein